MSDCASIPQANPGASYAAHRAEIDEAVAAVLRRGRYILGEEVTRFEREFERWLGAEEGTAIGVNSGTDALELALRVLGIGRGGAVLAPSHTAVATIAAIERAGARPVLLDVDPFSYTVDPSQLEAVLHGRSDLSGCRPAAVIAVHLYGQPADMTAILDVARRNGLRVIEDCAQSHGARLNGRMTGTFGDVAAFSFYPTKNLGGFGDGGLVLAGDRALADRARSLREYGWKDRSVSIAPGINSRLDELQAAILRVKLPRLDADNQRRIAIAKRYSSGLNLPGLVVPAWSEEEEHVFHQYVLRVSEGRDQLRSHLQSAGIATAVHYPIPVHCQPAYRGRGLEVEPLTRTEKICQEIVSLPMFPHLTDDQVDRVINSIEQWIELRTNRQGSLQ